MVCSASNYRNVFNYLIWGFIYNYYYPVKVFLST